MHGGVNSYRYIHNGVFLFQQEVDNSVQGSCSIVHFVIGLRAVDVGDYFLHQVQYTLTFAGKQ